MYQDSVEMAISRFKPKILVLNARGAKTIGFENESKVMGKNDVLKIAKKANHRAFRSDKRNDPKL
ncbi:hypothetical protein [Campylobacter gastrosuis]|uniref:Uncharacterized protein n=1 Tax=Campylobacter gastrosuis TaxID=2974576 RepID=A0ABT7HS11_9BACT|nr:hypothetical protein [Campylobacter gastrosuis]MDL0089706.1 hypothetical protein [Campylobacter gastrosuis]